MLNKILHKNCNRSKTKDFNETSELMSGDLKNSLGTVTGITIDDNIDAVYFHIKLNKLGKSKNLKNKAVQFFIKDTSIKPNIPTTNTIVKDGV